MPLLYRGNTGQVLLTTQTTGMGPNWIINGPNSLQATPMNPQGWSVSYLPSAGAPSAATVGVPLNAAAGAYTLLYNQEQGEPGIRKSGPFSVGSPVGYQGGSCS